MQDVAFALVLMTISAAVAIRFGQKPGVSKTAAYSIGLATMLAVTVVLFAVRYAV